MVDIKSLSDEELIELAESLHEAVYVSDCYGARDVAMYELKLQELEKRGYKVQQQKQIRIYCTEQEGGQKF